MRKIHSFKEFNFLYEAEVAGPPQTQKSKLYDQTLGMILTTILNSYSSLISYPSSSYDSKIESDIDSVKSSPIGDKVNAFLKIMEKVKDAASGNRIDGAQEAVDAWVSVGSKAGEALGSMIDQYKDQPEEQKYIDASINASLENYINDLKGASEENTLKKDIEEKTNESQEEEGDSLFEGIFQGKKGMIEDVSKQITIVLAKLAAFENTPGMSDEVSSLRNEVNQIAVQMANLLDMKNKDIKKEDIKKASARLSEIPTLLDKASQQMLKQDTTNKEAASILVQALALIRNAKEKEIKYLSKKEEVEREEDRKAEESEKVTYSPERMKEVDPRVMKFQELVVDKFKNNKQIIGLTSYKKMGTDGKYGPATKSIVEIMKSGFGLKDTSGETITREIIRELEAQESLKESRIFTFGQYSDLLKEAFDIEAAILTAKKLEPSVKGSSGSGRSKTKSGSLYRKGDTGNVVIAINRIVGQKGDENTYTDETVQKVKDFQKINGLKDDGIVGEATLKSLYDTRSGATTRSQISDKSAKRGPWAYKTIADVIKETYDGGKGSESEEAKTIAKKIYDAATGGFGTKTDKFLSAIESINSLDLLRSVDYQLAKIRAGYRTTEDSKLKDFARKKIDGYKNNIQYYVNDEMESDDYGTVKSISDALNKIKGAKALYLKDGDSFKTGSFKLTF